MEKSKVHRAALAYLKYFKFSVVPLKPKKGEGAFIKWGEFKDKLPTAEQIDYWWTLWPEAMIGAVTGKISNLAVVDLDLYKMDEAQKQAALSLIPDTVHVPIVSTPRGGQHLFFSMDGISPADLRTCQDIAPFVDFQGEGGVTPLPPSGNGSGSYSWQQGCHLKDITPIPPIPPNLVEAIKKRAFKPAARGPVLDTDGLMTTEGRRDQDFFHVANCMIKGGLEPEYAHRVLQIVAERANQGAHSPYTEAQVKEKIKGALARAERRDRNLSAEFKDWATLQGPGFFSLPQAFKDLEVFHKEEKAIIYNRVKEMVQQGILERGERSGVLRIVEKITDFVDISQTEDLTYLDIKWPLRCEEYVKISPKSISIIAGEVEVGKSAFCSAFAHLNMDKHEIFYFSSEMTASRFKNRISKLERPVSDWSRLKFTDQAHGNFQDLIQPDAINIIDYLELDAEKLYTSANIIRSIFQKLNKGIAVIAMQKKEGMKWAYGQDWTAQKAEFYLTLSREEIKGEPKSVARILKGKNWRSDMVNPLGHYRYFKLYKGIQFFPDKELSNWKRPEKFQPYDLE